MRSLLAMAFIAFPLTVYFLLEHWPARAFVVLFGVLACARLLLTQTVTVPVRLLGSLAIGLFCLIAWHQQALGVVKLYPVLMSLGGAGYGLYTLFYPPSAIERLARAMGMPVDSAGERYTRGVTRLWVGFFILNAGVACYTALATSTAAWSLYNGLISYLIIGVLLGAEYLYRGYYRRQQSESTP